MAASEQCKKAILGFFVAKGGGITSGVSTHNFDLVTDMGFDRDEVWDSLQALVNEDILRDGGRIILAGKNF